MFKLDIFSSIFVVSTAATTSVTISFSAVLFSLQIVSVFLWFSSIEFSVGGAASSGGGAAVVVSAWIEAAGSILWLLSSIWREFCGGDCVKTAVGAGFIVSTSGSATGIEAALWIEAAVSIFSVSATATFSDGTSSGSCSLRTSLTVGGCVTLKRKVAN